MDCPPLIFVLAPSTGAPPVGCLLSFNFINNKNVSDWMKNGRVVTVCGMDSDVPFCVLCVEFYLIFLVLSVANWPRSLWRPSEFHSDFTVPELGVRTGHLAPTPGTDLWASVSSSVWWARCGVRMWEICLSGSLLSLPDPWNGLCLVIQ